MAWLKEQAGRLHARNLRISGIALLLCVMGLAAPAPSAAQTRIVLGTEKPQESPAVIYLNLVYAEAFRRLGIGFRSESLPGKRSSLWSEESRQVMATTAFLDAHGVSPKLARQYCASGWLEDAGHGA